ncbi:hypothetical protein KEM60_02605 [Austwickia sp. TVS 96-490-7B]|uniref:DUF929 family protein n=1 Tax=Austwickia sp. TVS 96-490-7B TaxID=2830843 RepID=UPI001C565675|nr:DUF929 family protein [Austwickia sp. TVS 96-490-7B]MBW3086387.1 hypothetical protein [Austwickia sp. TVS 96-490-7B]
MSQSDHPSPPSTPHPMQAEQRSHTQRGKAVRTAIAAVCAVALVVVGMWALTQGTGGTSSPAASATPTPRGTGSGAYVKAMVSVPAADLDAVGAGTVAHFPTPVTDGKVEKVDGKPRVLYVGAEFCPFCAVQRWPLVIALSRFGTFDGLQPSLSSPEEGALSDIPSVTFKSSRYTSEYLHFDGVELSDRHGQPMAELTPADKALKAKLNPRGGIPWLYWGTATSGTSYDGTSFLPGADGDAIAAKLKDTSSPEARAILGSANMLTAHLCTLTDNKPADVCTSRGVTAAAPKK